MKSFSTGGREEDPSVQGHVAASVSLLPSPRLSYAAAWACMCPVPLALSLLLLAWAQVKHRAVPWLLPAATPLSHRSQGDAHGPGLCSLGCLRPHLFLVSGGGSPLPVYASESSPQFSWCPAVWAPGSGITALSCPLSLQGPSPCSCPPHPPSCIHPSLPALGSSS